MTPRFPLSDEPNTGDTMHVSIGAGASNVAVGKDITQIIGYTAEQVSVLIAQVRTADMPRTWDGRIPYLGLAAFQEADAGFFFGREALVDTLLERVQRARFLCIAGPSGSGKSSLVQAGLIHALRMGRLDGSRNWLYASLLPRDDPIEQLALAMSRVTSKPDGTDNPTSFHQQTETLLGHAPGQRFVLYVDQFEELFTQTKNEERRTSFLALLIDAVTRDDGRVTIIISMRSDFLSQCASYPALLSLINQQFQLVGAMSSQELALAILKPALAVGAEIEPDLVAQVITDMKGESGALPLMQFALKDLFAAHPHKQGDVVKLTLSDYVDRGGIQEALERYANATFAQFDDVQQEIARVVFSHLIEVGRGTLDTRRTATFDELVTSKANQDDTITVINALVNARLVTTGMTEDHQRTLTVAHEKLIEAWPWLSRLVNDNREAIALQNDIAYDARQWAESHRDPSYLYTGALLATVREQISERKIELTGLAAELVTTAAQIEDKRVADKVAVQKRQIRRRNWAIGILSAMLLPLFFVVLFFGIREWRRDHSPWKFVEHFPQEDATIALSYSYVPANNAYFYCVGTLDLGVGCSDNGRSWNIYQNGLPIGPPPAGGAGNFSGEQRGVTGISIDAVQPSVIYAYTMNGQIYKSADAGQRWQATSAVLPQLYVVDITAHNPFIVATAKDYQTDSGHSLYFSPDAGESWSLEIETGEEPFGRVHDAFIAKEPFLYIGTDAGIFQSPASATLVWTPIFSATGVLFLSPAIDELSIYAITASPENQNWSLLRLYGNGVVDTITTFQEQPVSLTVDPSPTSTTPIYVLLRNWEVIAVTPQGEQRNWGGWKNFGPAYSILAIPDSSTGVTRLLMGHLRGLLEYQSAAD